MIFYWGERGDVRRTGGRLFARRLQTWHYAGLAGAPDPAEVHVGTYRHGLLLEVSDPIGARFHAAYCVRRVGRDLVLFNEGFRILKTSMQGKGFGLWSFCRQVDNASRLGISRIQTVAGRREGENGYYTWPRFGFDGPLPRNTAQRLPPRLAHARTLLDLMQCEEGRRWWREHGGTLHVAFDLRDRSRCRTVLERYVCERLFREARPGWRASPARLCSALPC